MKLITRDTDYAIRAICFIAKQKTKIVSASELVEHLKIPRPFLRKILQILNKEGLLSSFKGQGGGFQLKVAPNKIFLVKLIYIFQGPVELNRCFLKKHACPNMKTCILKKKLDTIERYVSNKLTSITVASLLKGEGAAHGKKKNNKNRR